MNRRAKLRLHRVFRFEADTGHARNADWLQFDNEDQLVEYLISIIRKKPKDKFAITHIVRRYTLKGGKFKDYNVDKEPLMARAKEGFIKEADAKAEATFLRAATPARARPKVYPTPGKKYPKGGDLGRTPLNEGGLGSTGRGRTRWPAALCDSREPCVPLVPSSPADLVDPCTPPHSSPPSHQVRRGAGGRPSGGRRRRVPKK